jgi:short-subunit dehydrogenase involved in D-alanine esterification of teichoic acids
MAPLYRKALIVGATSGIGEALAGRLVSCGTKIVLVGRRVDRLDAVVSSCGSDKATGLPFDVTSLGEISAFAEKVIESHPDLDCVVVNSGIQRRFDFTKPESVNLDVLASELTTNYTSAVYLTAAFLPHLRSQGQGHIVYVSATLGLIPSLTRTPNYNASKSALHTFIIDVRQQLKDAGQHNVRLVEVFPPAVQTELHDEKHQPDLVNGGEIGMPLDAYIEAMYEGLLKGDEQFAIGPGEPLLKDGGWEDQRSKLFQEQRVLIEKSLARFLK